MLKQAKYPTDEEDRKGNGKHLFHGGSEENKTPQIRLNQLQMCSQKKAKV